MPLITVCLIRKKWLTEGSSPLSELSNEISSTLKAKENPFYDSFSDVTEKYRSRLCNRT